jgi:hypothetical protein
MAAYSRHEPKLTAHFGFGTPSNNARIPRIYKSLGSVNVEQEMRVLVRTFGARAFAATHLRSGGPVHLAQAIGGAARQARSGRRATETSGALEIETLARFDDRTDLLWASIRESFDLSLDRGAEFMNWRYERAGGEAAVRALVKHDQILGYAISKRSDGWASVVDLVVDPGDDDTAAALLEDACELARAAGCDGVSCWLPAGHPQLRAARMAGFGDIGRPGVVQFWAHSAPELLDSLRPASLRMHMTLGDFDFV